MKKLLLTLAVVLGGLTAFAQNFTFSGTITETGTGNPVANHTVTVMADSSVMIFTGTAVTDASGNYTIVIPNGAQIGPNVNYWAWTDSCNGYASFNFQNMQGTVNSATWNLSICGASANCGATFTHQDSAGTAMIYFAPDVYDSANTYTWSFGDGATAVGPSPNHYYSATGQYYVCLTVSNATCTTTECSWIVVNPTNNACIANFWAFADSLNNTVYLVNNSSWNANMQYVWEFGDGNTGTGQYPSHTYANYGTYLVCLTIADGAGCTDTYCQSVTFQPFMNDDNSRSGFTLVVIAPTALTVEEENAVTEFKAYPNPANEIITLDITGNIKGNVSIQVVDMLGKNALEVPAVINAGNNRIELNLSTLQNGMYLLSVRSADGSNLQTIRIIKQ
ncbi:MAG: PKD domain-containing protein [Flavobacteriales bacterium]